MSSHKTIVCRCEDVTRKDVEHALELGYTDIEEIKRYTGLGTGPCQGKECMALVASLLDDFHARGSASAEGRPAITPFTTRPPIEPTPLSFFAALSPRDDRDRHGGGGGDR